MQPIDTVSFQRKIKYAQIICAPEHGYYICFDKKSPYEKSLFQIPENSELFISEHHFGELLKLKKDGKVSMIAFVFDPELLPVFE